MLKNNFKIVSDSSCDRHKVEGIPFEAAPLKIVTTQKEYVDNANLNVLEMVNELQSYKGKSSTSCPNASEWLDAFGDTKYIFCVTITGTLSGSYNAACIAKETYEEEHPDRKVFVLNSLTTGPEIILIIQKINELILKGNSFEDICEEITEYTNKTGLLFMLESMKNLANNGRVSPLVAKMAGILGIRIVGKASSKGDLQPLDKSRGEVRAIRDIIKNLKAEGYCGGKIIITHCFNENAAGALKEMLLKEFVGADIEISTCGGLCSFYAEKGGMIIGFEKK